MINAETGEIILEDRLFNPKHFIPFYGIKPFRRDMRHQERIDNDAPLLEQLPRINRMSLYECGVTLWHSSLATAGLLGIAYAASKLF